MVKHARSTRRPPTRRAEHVLDGDRKAGQLAQRLTGSSPPVRFLRLRERCVSLHAQERTKDRIMPLDLLQTSSRQLDRGRFPASEVFEKSGRR
jgi:hypothetical protein